MPFLLLSSTSNSMPSITSITTTTTSSTTSVQSPTASSYVPIGVPIKSATVLQPPIAGSANASTVTTSGEVPQIPPYIRTTAMCLCISIMVLGVIGNIMVPIVIVKSKDMRNSTNIFLTNLSIADLLVLLVCTPTVLVEVNTRPETWILGHEMCKAVPFIELTVAHASVLTILAISFERYYAICEPLKAGYVCTKTRAILICVLAWCIAALFTCPILWVAEYKYLEYVDGSSVAVCLTQAITKWTIGFFLMTIIVFFILPLIVLIVLYGIIAKNLISSHGPMMRIRPSKPEVSLKARKQVVLMLGAVVLSFFICLLPFRLLTLWIILSSEHTFLNIGIERYYNLLYFCRIMLYLNSAINPVLYNLMSTKFRKGFFRLSCNSWSYLLVGLSCGHHQRTESTTLKMIAGAAATNTTSNTATTTSSSMLSRSSNRRSSEDICTKTRVQIQMQIPWGSESEMLAMLHTADCKPDPVIIKRAMKYQKQKSIHRNRRGSAPAHQQQFQMQLQNFRSRSKLQFSFDEEEVLDAGVSSTKT